MILVHRRTTFPTVAAVAALFVGTLFSFARPAQAWPKFSQAEGKSCAYCHTNPAGGGARNYRGLFYKAHNLSFAGFDDAAEAKKAGVDVGPDASPVPKSLKPAATPAADAPTAPNTPAKNLLVPTTNLAGWHQQVGGTAEARFAQDGDAIRVTVTKASSEAWNVMLTQHLPGKGGPNGLEEGKYYVLRFRAKADPPRNLSVTPQINRDPYSGIGLSENVALTTEWQTFALPFTAADLDETDNRVPNFMLADKVGSVWIADASLTLSAKPKPAASARPLPPTPADPASVPDLGEAAFDGMAFVKIPAGTFRRGTDEAQQKALQAAGLWSHLFAAEQPGRDVRITRPFFIGKYEVTQAEWKAVMEAAAPPAAPAGGGGRGKKGPNPATPSTFKGDDRPVETVSAADAAEFIRRLNRASGTRGRYRLPTEAEWEYVARAGGDSPWGLGENKAPITPDNLGDYAWFSPNAKNTTHDVGTKKPNAWNIHDILGNVWEWTQDAYDPAFYAAGADADPVFKSRDPDAERVLRGGCWFLDARAARAGMRGGNLPTFKSQYAGLRLVREL